MKTPMFTFTVIPIILALLVGALSLPALNIFQVNARGLGHEHGQPWRKAAKTIADALRFDFAHARATFVMLSRHPLFSPATAGAALGLAFLVNGAALFAAPLLTGVLTEGVHTAEFLAWEGGNSLRRETVTVLSGQDLDPGEVCGRVSMGIGRVSIPTVVGTGTGTVSAVFAGPNVEVGNYVLTCTAAVAHGGVFSLTSPSGKVLPTLTMTPGSGGSTVYTSSHINFTITDSTDFIVGDVFTFVVGTTAPTVIGGTGTGVMTALSLGPDAQTGNYKVINRAVVAEGGDFEVIAPDGTSIGRFLMGTTSTGTAAFTSRHINFTLSDATDYILGNYFNVAVFNQLIGGKVVAWDPTTFDGRHRVAGLLYAAVDASLADTKGVLICRDAVVIKPSLQWGAAITSAQKDVAYEELAAMGVIAREGVTS